VKWGGCKGGRIKTRTVTRSNGACISGRDKWEKQGRCRVKAYDSCLRGEEDKREKDEEGNGYRRMGNKVKGGPASCLP